MTSTTMTAVIGSINSGLYDGELTEMIKAAEARLLTVRKERVASAYCIGDRVKFNNFAGTKYLHGHRGVITAIRGKKVMVKLDNPVGRFSVCVDGEWRGSEVLCPPSIVDLV